MNDLLKEQIEYIKINPPLFSSLWPLGIILQHNLFHFYFIIIVIIMVVIITILELSSPPEIKTFPHLSGGSLSRRTRRRTACIPRGCGRAC